MAHVAIGPNYPPSRLFDRGLDLFFPPVCVGCRRVGRWICVRCWQLVPWIEERTCFECRRPSTTVTCIRCSGKAASLERLIAVADFEGVAREAVHTLKFNGRHAIAGLLGTLMAEAARDVETDFVVHVPLHRSRLRERGYDQSALLARSIARAGARRHHARALRRIRPTAQQASLDADARRSNVAGAFQSTRAWNGETIILVDDVSTTGATLDAAASALRKAGAGGVIGLVFAHRLG